MGIRELTDNWVVQSYEDGCESVELSKKYEESTIERLKHYLCKLERFYKNMDGNSVEHLIRYKCAEEYNKIRFTNIVNQMMKDDDFTPVKYMAQITKLCDEYKLSDEMTIGMLARGLRSFPSFLREIDAKEQLEKVLKERRISYSIIRNPEMDVLQHTDIKILVKNKEYCIWLFQNSANGERNTTERLREKRGKLPKGIHILCPMNPANPMSENRTYVKKNGWCFYSVSYIENIIDCVENFMIEKIPMYDAFIQNIDLSKEEIQIFIK